MKTIGIVGKRYEDIKLYADSNQIGESNNCSTIDKCLGGMYNFKITGKEECILVMIENGIKKAYIIEESKWLVTNEAEVYKVLNYAYEKYDEKLKMKFSTYAFWWVKNYITKLMNQDHHYHLISELIFF